MGVSDVSFVVGVDYEFGIGVNEMKPLLIARLYRQSILSIHKLINQLSSCQKHSWSFVQMSIANEVPNRYLAIQIVIIHFVSVDWHVWTSKLRFVFIACSCVVYQLTSYKDWLHEFKRSKSV